MVEVTHSLQYVYTGVTPGINFPEFTALGQVDGQQFDYYDSKIRKKIPKMEWILKVNADDPHYWNKGTQILQGNQETFKVNMNTAMQRFNQTAVPPTASVFQKHSVSRVGVYATGFFPKTVMITWQKDGEDVYEDVDLGETLPNQDGSFQKRSVLTVSAEDLQKHTYTCMIQHSSLEKEMVLHKRDLRILNPDVISCGRSGGAPIGIIVGVVAVLLVLVVVVAGIVVWKKKNSGFKPVPPKPGK
ncbi:hypothetical protein AMELA_G00242650 [Ameiurus melas]|uniref:Ig-like domain-containing protein n=1 Tax=Ameiurus melas TaxID=219545 RepID=A0A7J5ZWD3_AMEME|nr:hypothetical protein AMELA_G00242650 [Ameiurus melas]